METLQKLAVLADAAKYDASCASSGAPRRHSKNKAGLGTTNGDGICHSFTPDGRCISLLKILLTNFCLYDCQYCINRRTSNVQRARFTVDEVVRLTLDFYRRNYIEGLFLSSGVIRSSDYTMEQLVNVARALRIEHQFRGYIHLKTIPDASSELIELAGRYADRLSVNIELPTEIAMEQLAPEKKVSTIKLAMATIRKKVDETQEEKNSTKSLSKAAEQALRFSPAGQSTQMIVGADATCDRTILDTSQNLYASYRLKRVYYSAFSPIPQSPSTVPSEAPPLLREHRLYQADFLIRSYGFQAQELLTINSNLDLEIDPKLAWALNHRDLFPVDLNRAELHLIARVPGIGIKNAERIHALRLIRRVKYADLIRLRCSLKKAQPFITLDDWKPRQAEIDSQTLRQTLTNQSTAKLPNHPYSSGFKAKQTQLSLWQN